MAFDLNKNEGSKKEPAKFDLSKGTADNAAPKSRTWLFGLLGLLIVGGGIWYYATRTSPAADQISSITNPPADSVSTATTVLPDSSKQLPAVAPVPQNASEKEPDPAVEVASIAGQATIRVAALNHTVPVTFAQGSVAFASTNKLLVKRIVAYLNENPGASVQVNGYASSDGTLAVNQSISQARADAFKQYLIAAHVAENRVIAAGKGIANPIASNKTSAGRKKNRRVEVTFL